MSTRPAHYWRNLAITLGLALVSGGCIIAGFIAFSTARLSAKVLEPPRIAVDRTPGIPRYRDMTFTASDGVTLRGWYVPSRSGAAILLAHGYGGNRLELLPEAELLAGQGYGVLLFDFRGHGASENALVTVGFHEQRDLTAALDFVESQPDVDPGRIGAVGFSMGAATLVEVAAQDTRLRAVVIEAAFDTLDHVIRDKAGLFGPLSKLPAQWSITHEGVNIDAVRPVDALCNISPRPVLLIYGDQDDTIPPGAQRAMFAAACPPADTWLIPGAKHENFLAFAGDVYAARLSEFFAQELGK